MTPGPLVLVPLDGTPFAEQALPTARLIARLARGSLLLAHAVERPTPASELQALQAGIVDDAPTTRERRRVAQDYLDDVVARMTRRAGDVPAAEPPARGVLLDGDPARAVHDAAVVHGAELVVMASHDRSALGRLLVGSTAEHVAREPGVPVLIVRRHEHADVGAGDSSAPGAPADPTTREAARLRHLLVPLDGTPEAEAVLAPALALARLMDAAVTLLNVHDPREDRAATLLPTAILATSHGDEHRPVDVAAEAPEDVGAYLDALARRLAAEGLRADARTVRGHGVAEAIVRCAGELGADLIAMSTHGRGAWGHLLHGSVAEAVLHRVLMPVLLLRPRPTPAADAIR